MAKRTVILTGNELCQFSEDDKAGAAIVPGMILGVNGSGDWIPAAAGTAVQPKRWAIEREYMGGDYNTAYATGDAVKVATTPPGVRINALIANTVNVAKGGLLEVGATAGTLRPVTTGVPVAVSLEALNNTSGANARLRVEIV